EKAIAVRRAYFPFVQGLHILLDYYIDQQEEIDEGDLNFCFYYPDWETMKNRFLDFIDQAHQQVQALPDRSFHEMVHQGLVGLYLGDPKAARLDKGAEMKEALLQKCGPRARFFHWNTKVYYKWRRK